jgi:large repetitive protein
MLRSRIIVGIIAVTVLAILAVSGCDELITQTDEITIAGNPTADFTMTPDSACVPVTVNFKDASSGPVVRWFWKFGDGDTMTTDTGFATHTYDSVGSYIVTLVVYDTLDGKDEEIKKRAVIVGQSIDSFYASPDSGCVDNEFTFHPVGYNGITYWKWRFGDGDSAITDTGFASHTYTEAGVHVVTLIVSGGCGVDTLFDTVQTVLCPTTYFVTHHECAPKTMKFSDSSRTPDAAYPIDQWLWQFGNVTCHRQDTTITFTSAGVHSVSLTTTIAGGGSSTYTSTVYVWDSVMPGFTATPTQSCHQPWRQFVVRFTDTTVGEADSLVWYFGDGDTAWNDPTPAHAYIEPGVYSPELWVYTCETVRKAIKDRLIIYSDSLEPPVFTVSPPDSAVDTTTFTFTDLSTGVVLSRSWSIKRAPYDTTAFDTTVTGLQTFSRKFVDTGTYKVRLTVGNLCGTARDSTTFRIVQ